MIMLLVMLQIKNNTCVLVILTEPLVNFRFYRLKSVLKGIKHLLHMECIHAHIMNDIASLGLGFSELQMP